MLPLSAILSILLPIIDPSQKAMTIRINSVYLVDKRPKFGPPQDQDGDILGDLGKYAIHVYGTLSSDEGFHCTLNSILPHDLKKYTFH